MVHFKFPVGALVVLYPGFEFFDRTNACSFEDEFALGSYTFNGGEGCGLEEFQVFAYSLEGDSVVFCVMLSEGTPEEMPVDVAQGV